MRIAFVHRHHAPEGGGQRLLLRVVQQLVEEGEDVHVLTESWPDTRGVALHIVPRANGSPTSRVQGFVDRCGRIVQQESFDVVFGWDYAIPLDIFRAGEGLCTERIKALDEQRTMLGRRMARMDATYRAQLAVEREIFSPGNVRHVVANSLKAKFEIVETYDVPQDRVHVIYNGVDLERFNPRERDWWRPETRRQLGVPEGQLLILFVGNDFERQGLDLAVNALQEGFPEEGAHLVVAGAGDPRKFWLLARKPKVAERIQFLGPVDVVERFYSAADVLVHPARYDPFPSEIVEAMASGLPVLTTPQCGGAEAIEDGKSGYIVESVSQLVDGLRLVADPDRRIEMGRLARERAGRFPMEDQVQRTIRLIRTVASEKDREREGEVRRR